MRARLLFQDSPLPPGALWTRASRSYVRHAFLAPAISLLLALAAGDAVAAKPKDAAAAKPKFLTIDVPGSVATRARAINNSDVIVGYYFDGTASHGFIRNPRTRAITTVDYPGADWTELWGINNDGVCVGCYGEIDENLNGHGFVYDAGEFTTIDMPDADVTSAHDINDDGVIVGDFLEPGSVRRRVFVYDGDFQTFDAPEAGEYGTYASGITNRGIVTGHYWGAEEELHGYMYDRQYRTVDIPGAIGTGIGHANEKGAYVGGYDHIYGSTGFLRSGRSTTLLNFPGSYSTFAYGINDRGTIVGVYVDPNERIQAFTTGK